MARKRVADPLGLSSWEEADRLLGTLAERQREVERIQLELEERIATLKNDAKKAMDAHQAAIAEGEKQRALFARLHEKARMPDLTEEVHGNG